MKHSGIEQLKSIENFPGARSLTVSGLNQEYFEDLIGRFGRQFEAITERMNRIAMSKE